jgi:hypothetical protein
MLVIFFFETQHISRIAICVHIFMLNITVYTLLEIPLTNKNTILDDPQSQQGVFVHYEKIMIISKINLQYYAVTGAHKFSVKSISYIWFMYKFIFIYITYILNFK